MTPANGSPSLDGPDGQRRPPPVDCPVPHDPAERVYACVCLLEDVSGSTADLDGLALMTGLHPVDVLVALEDLRDAGRVTGEAGRIASTRQRG